MRPASARVDGDGPAACRPTPPAEKLWHVEPPVVERELHAQVARSRGRSASVSRPIASVPSRVDPAQRREVDRRIGNRRTSCARAWRGAAGAGAPARSPAAATRSARAPAPDRSNTSCGRAPPVTTANDPVSALAPERELEVVERIARGVGLDPGGERELLPGDLALETSTGYGQRRSQQRLDRAERAFDAPAARRRPCRGTRRRSATSDARACTRQRVDRDAVVTAPVAPSR